MKDGRSIENMFSLKNKNCIVTGAAGLIGRSISHAILQAGGSLIMIDLNTEGLNEIEKKLKTNFPKTTIMSYSFDLTQKDDIEKFLQSQGDRSIDVLINNAAINDTFKKDSHEESKYENYYIELWEKNLRWNLTSVFLMCQCIGTRMKEQRGGSIINISSTYGLVAPDQTLYQDELGKQMFYKGPGYPVTKAGVIALTKFCAAYWKGCSVRVNAICPGGVEDGQDPYFMKSYSQRTLLERMAKPDDYNGAIIFLASDASQYMTGAVVVVDGGWTVC